MKLLAAALLAAAAPSLAHAARFEGGRLITVRMTDHGFVPSTIVMRAGQDYRLRFINTSGRGHDFTSNAFLGAARVAPRDGYLLRHNKIDLDPGQSATLHVKAPRVHGARFEFHSQHLTDAASGLKGNIYVQ